MSSAEQLLTAYIKYCISQRKEYAVSPSIVVCEELAKVALNEVDTLPISEGNQLLEVFRKVKVAVLSHDQKRQAADSGKS